MRFLLLLQTGFIRVIGEASPNLNRYEEET